MMSDSPLQPWMDLLSEETRDVLRRVEWRTVRRLSGRLLGGHTSPAKGSSQEFAEHRSYAPGDDVRRLDWKVMARTERDVVKCYVEDSNTRVTLLVDTSLSMNYVGAAGVSKLNYAKQLAAALAYIFLKQGDSVGLGVYGQVAQMRVFHSSRQEQLNRILSCLHTLETTESNGGLIDLANDLPARSVVIVLGDLLDDDEIHALRELGVGRSLIIMQILAREELSFPFSGHVQFRDMETFETVATDAGLVRDEYQRLLTGLLKEVELVTLETGGEWVQAVSDESLVEVLLSFLVGGDK